MKQKITALLLALILLALPSCAPTGTEGEDATKQPDPPNALETEPDGPPELQTYPVNLEYFVDFDSKLGCSLAYDPIFFEAEDVVDENQPIESVVSLAVQSVWENDGFPILVTVTPLDASSVEEAIINHMGGLSLDDPGEETTFGTGGYTATHFTYHKVYAIGEIYVTEQNGTVFEVQVSSYHRPPEKELAHAYAILDSITF